MKCTARNAPHASPQDVALWSSAPAPLHPCTPRMLQVTDFNLSKILEDSTKSSSMAAMNPRCVHGGRRHGERWRKSAAHVAPAPANPCPSSPLLTQVAGA